MKRFLKILLLLVVLFVIFCLYIFFVPHGGARRKLAEYKKQLIAQGEKLDLLSLVPPPLKGVSNGAPEFLGVITNWTRPNDNPAAMKMVAPGYAAFAYTNPGLAVMASYEANKATAKKLRAIFDSSALAFEFNYSNVPNIDFTPLTSLKAAALLFGRATMQALYTNDFQEAFLNAGGSADLVRLYTNEPMEICVLVRIACANIAVGVTWEGLQRADWSDQQLATLQAKWEGMEFFANLDRVMAAERAFGIAGMAEARKATNVAQLDPLGFLSGTPTNTSFGDWIGELFKDPRAALKDVYERYPKFWMWKSSWSYEEELCGLQMNTAVVEMCRRIKTVGYCAPALAELSTQVSNIFLAYPKAESHFLASYYAVTGTLERGLVKAAQAECSRRLLITAIALQRYHLRHSAWPDTLNQLVPDFLAQVPVDFMDGKPLRYKPVKDGRYLLYSVGEDGKDDGGDGSPSDSTASVRFLGMRDLVWPQPASPQQIREFEDRQMPRNSAPPPQPVPPPADQK